MHISLIVSPAWWFLLTSILVSTSGNLYVTTATALCVLLFSFVILYVCLCRNRQYGTSRWWHFSRFTLWQAVHTIPFHICPINDAPTRRRRRSEASRLAVSSWDKQEDVNDADDDCAIMPAARRSCESSHVRRLGAEISSRVGAAGN